jgi:Thrombospondin type 3 repeat
MSHGEMSMSDLRVPVRLFLQVLLLIALAGLAACSKGDVSAPADDDADGVANTVDNCPTIQNPGQVDQDMDMIGDVCDISNDNPVIAVATSDLTDSDRDFNDRTCSSTEVLSGITAGFEPTSSYVDTFYYRCTTRFAPFETTEDVGESASIRGVDVECASTEVVVGLAYKEIEGSTLPDDALAAATLLCAPTDGPDTNPRFVPNARFDANQGAAITLQCPEGATAVGIQDIDSDTNSNNSDVIDGLGILCREGRWTASIG